MKTKYMLLLFSILILISCNGNSNGNIVSNNDTLTTDTAVIVQQKIKKKKKLLVEGEESYEIIKMDSLYDVKLITVRKVEQGHYHSSGFKIGSRHEHDYCHEYFFHYVSVIRGGMAERYYYEDVVFNIIPDTCEPRIEDRLLYLNKDVGIFKHKVEKCVQCIIGMDLREYKGNSYGIFTEWIPVSEFEQSNNVTRKKYIHHYIYISESMEIRHVYVNL